MADEVQSREEKSLGGVDEEDVLIQGTRTCPHPPRPRFAVPYQPEESDAEISPLSLGRPRRNSIVQEPRDRPNRIEPELELGSFLPPVQVESPWIPGEPNSFKERSNPYRSINEWQLPELKRRTKSRLTIVAINLQKYLDNDLKIALRKLPDEMGAQTQLIFVDGSFAELAQEMADYEQIGDQVKPLLEKDQREEALQTIVKASSFLNSIPEKEFTAAYNLLIHLVLQSKEPKKYLPTVCGNLLKPITSSPVHGVTLAANALATIFNLIESDNSLRYNVFMQILRFIKQNNQYDILKPRLKNVPSWLSHWDMDDEDQRKMYVEIVDVAYDGGDKDYAYVWLLKALHTFDRDEQEEVTSKEAQELSLRALRIALLSPAHFDFNDLRSYPTVQALSDSHAVYAQLLDIFAEQDLEDYNDFREEHEGWIEKENLSHEVLQEKMRLLTFASLAASSQNREISYAHIAKALQIPAEDVEKWCIDTIRSKLVEGRLSQQKQIFLVQRTAYRVFGEKQWRELGTRVDQYKTTVDHLVDVVRRQQVEAAAQKEREVQEVERKLAGTGMGGGGQGRDGDRRRGGQQHQRQHQQHSQQQRERGENDD